MSVDPGAVAAAPPALRIVELTKRYGTNQVLSQVSFDVAAGEVVGLIGTNGAGKSTLIKILSGAVAPSEGAIEVAGDRFSPSSPLDAVRAGIQTVHQEIDAGTVLGATVAENLTLDSLAPAAGPAWRTQRATRREAAEVAGRVGLTVDLSAPIESLTASDRQRVIIARALAHDPRLLVLDEPTSSLSGRESRVLLDMVRELAAAGVAVLFVSHDLSEVEQICDRVVVLRDGVVRRVVDRPYRVRELVEAMLGTVAVSLDHEVRRGGDVVLAARGVRTRPDSQPFDLELRGGEVVGITGLVGAGKTELLEQLYGARPLVSGTVSVDGARYQPRSPATAVAAGVALVAEERGAEAVVPTWTVRHHVTLPRLRAHSRRGVLSTASERRSTERTIAGFGVVGGGGESELTALSGGNQQKVLVGRWFDGPVRVALLDEPLRGVDVGARADLVAQLRQQAAAGDVAIAVASSDPAEIVQIADRVIVFSDGDKVGELSVADVTTEQLSRLMAADDTSTHATDAEDR